MKKPFRIAFVFAMLFNAAVCMAEAPLTSIKYVTVADIQASLPQKPIVAGFDIDDTVLFSSPGFFYGMSNRDGRDSTNIYGSAPLQSKEFWNDMNGQFDKFSMPKKSGGDLVRMHIKRGDKVVFITARHSSEKSIVPRILMQDFRIPASDVIFTSDSSKTKFISANNVYVYYGDADSDMKQAKEAKARPVRVMRSSFSTNQASPYHPGAFGEEVVKDSEN